ncbi:hypothetical protein [Pararhizobium arenae]|uniref:hypothetical protein n=1 Tax=Pararhizobium arenae TaxID=1856850 RepID=UPI000A693BDE|nr:hypothetical protein [Pararhizobium arenae]
MNNHLASTAPACAHSIPHVYTAETVNAYLAEKSVRYRARPVYSGPAISVTVTLTDLIIDPPFDIACGSKPGGLDRQMLTGLRRYLGGLGCDAIRLDGRALPIEGTDQFVIDFVRICLLKDSKPVRQKLIIPEFPDGDDTVYVRHHLDISKAGAAAALGLADELSRAFAYRFDRPYSGVSANMDAVLWVADDIGSAPSFIVPLTQSARERAGDRPSTGSISGFSEAPHAAASTGVLNADGPGLARPSALGCIHPSRSSATVLSECRQVLTAEDMMPWLDREVTYVGYPIFEGPDCSVVLTQNDPEMEGDLEEEDAAALRNLCDHSAEGLRTFFDRVTRRLPANCVRLDGRMVAEQQGGPSRPRICRVAVFNAGKPVAEFPYDEEIFDTDETFDRQLFTWISTETAEQSLHTLRKLACSAMHADRTGPAPVPVTGVLWLPVNDDRYRPSFHMPVELDLLPRSEALNFLDELFSKQVDDLYELDDMEISSWR